MVYNVFDLLKMTNAQISMTFNDAYALSGYIKVDGEPDDEHTDDAE